MPLPRVVVLLALLAGCAGRTFVAEPLAAPAVERPSPITALAEDPPLPGEPLGEWDGLEPSAPSATASVDDLVRIALERHPEIRAAGHDVEAARAARAAAGRLPNPEIEVAWLPGETEVTVALDLTDVALAPMRRHAADGALDAEEVRAAATAARLAYDVRAAAYALIAARETLALAERSLEAQAASLDLARAMFEAGNATALDTLTWEAAYETARQSVAARDREASAARERLAALIGEDPGRLAPFAPIPDAPPASGLEAEALGASLELAEARARLVGLARESAVVTAEGWWPDVSVGLVTVNEKGEAWFAGAVVEASIPLFAQGTARRAAVTSRYDATEARADQLVADLRAAARTTDDALASAHALAVHQRDVVVPLRRRIAHEALLQYNAMQIGPQDLLRALRDALEAETALVDATRAFWTAAAAAEALRAGVRVEAPLASTPTQAAAPASAGGH